MIIEKFYASIDALYEKIRTTQDENIKKASDLMLESIKNGGAIHIFDSGHLISHELLGRAGGAFFYNRLQYGLTVDSTSRVRDKSIKDTSMAGLAEYALKASKVEQGDILIIGSVSGKSMKVVDLAVAAKKMGITMIGITSVEYSSQLESLHPCGKKLYELVDLVINNCAPFGDGMVEVEELGQNILPASGMAAAYIMWAVTADLVDKMLAKGMKPSMFRSANFEKFRLLNEEKRKQYEKQGY